MAVCAEPLCASKIVLDTVALPADTASLVRHRRLSPGRSAIFAVAILLIFTPPSRAADPQPYNVNLSKTGDAALDQAFHDSSNLISLRESAPVGPFALIQRAREDSSRFVAALQSFGYYKGGVDITIAGRELEDSDLADFLNRAPADPPVTVTVLSETGPVFHIRKVDIEGAIPASARAQIGLAPGAPARAQDVLAAQRRLLDALQNDGYALAKVTMPAAIADPNTDGLDVTYIVENGPQVNIGKISIKGLSAVNRNFVEDRLLIHTGERFSSQAIEKARADLASLGVFQAVQASTSDKLDDQGQIPIEFDVVERPAHVVSFSAAYSTDLGVNLTTGWSDRNLFGNAEQLNLSAGISVGGSVEHGPSYNLNGQFIKPDFLDRDQSLQSDLGAVKQNLLAYDQDAATGDILLKRTFLPHWSGSIGILGEVEKIGQQGATHHFTLLGFPITAKFDNTDSLLDPTEGLRFAATATPIQSFGGSNPIFALLQISGSTYFDMSPLWNDDPGRSVVALRGLLGTAQGASQFEIPADQRFYAGGSATVRGYKYQSIGPQFADGTPQGGTSIVAGSVEFRQRILSDYGFAAFIDGGQVSASGSPFRGGLDLGAGIGARYYTSFGPIRFDVAIPLTKIPNGGTFEIYIGIGQAF